MEYLSFLGEYYVNNKIYYYVGCMCGGGKEITYVYDPETEIEHEVDTIKDGNYIVLDGVEVRSMGTGTVPNEILNKMPRAFCKYDGFGPKKGVLFPVVKQLREGLMLRVDGWNFYYLNYEDVTFDNQVKLF